MKPNPTIKSKFQTINQKVGSGLYSDIKAIDMKRSIIAYEISRYEVENGRTDRLAHDLRAEADNPLIHAGPGKIVFWVSGYDDASEEMFQIPAFRNFITKLNEADPCWIYYADPESYWPQMVAFCTATNAQAISRKGQARFSLSLSAQDIVSFLDRQLDQYDHLCSLAEISDQEASQKLKDVFDSFGVIHGILGGQSTEAQ